MYPRRVNFLNEYFFDEHKINISNAGKRYLMEELQKDLGDNKYSLSIDNTTTSSLTEEDADCLVFFFGAIRIENSKFELYDALYASLA